MRKAIFGAASALAVASPAVAADLGAPRYREIPTQREARTYEYRTAPRVVVEEAAPFVSETVVVRRPSVVAPRPEVVEEYPVYPAYPAPPVYGTPVRPGRARWNR